MFAALFAVVQMTYAQTFPSGLSADSVDPETDSLIMSQLKSKLNFIRSTQNRPTVAVVLSGGGAKGAAHVGALRYLEELQIPVDLICGTSMGGLVGGIYAMGYDSHFIDSLFYSQDWSVTLTDKVAPKYIPLSTKEYKSTYQLSIPFHYPEDAFSKRVAEQVKYTTQRKKFTLEAVNYDVNTQLGVNTLASSLPSGYVYGFNVNNLLSSFTVGYQDSLAFSKLPIPFCCVAADMVSCKAKYWGSGSLKTAMRSTMSIPGMFDPVRTHGMVLVDGGTRNNFPVDVARAAGADYVIGVDLSDLDPGYSQINNVGNILSQFIKMLGKDSFDRNINNADVFIKPDLKGYHMLSFNPAAIDTIINRGYQAALSQEGKLREIKSSMPDAVPGLHNPKAVNIDRHPVVVSQVEFKGVSEQEARTLHRKIKIAAGSEVDKAIMDDAMSRLQATGAFESVTYSLLGVEEPYRLVFNCSQAPVHQFGIGIRGDTEEWVALALNLGLNSHKLIGSKLSLDADIGQTQSARLRYSLDVPYIPTVNVEAFISNRNPLLYLDGSNQNYRFRFWTHSESIYLSNIQWTRLDIQLGARYHYFSMNPTDLYTQLVEALFGKDYVRGGYFGAFANAKAYTLDDYYYPSKGFSFKGTYDMDFSRPRATEFKPVRSAFIDFKAVIPIGSRFAIIPDVHTRNRFNSDQNIIFHTNYVGGAIPDRYIDGQVPFVGFGNLLNAKDHLIAVNLDFRTRIGKNFYLSAMGSVLQQSDTVADLFADLRPDYYGAALELGYKTIAGPVKLRVNWSDFTKKVGAYVSFGFDF